MEEKNIPFGSVTHMCGCIGPQNGEPLCPCAMREVVQHNGRWVRPVQDLGPVVPDDNNWGKTFEEFAKAVKGVD